MNNSNYTHRIWHRFVSVFLVFALFIGIFPARIIHAVDPEEDLFVSETAEEMAEDYAVWPYDTLPEEDDHLDDEDANITEENLLNRDEAIKDFRLDNGLNVAVSYPYSVHYKENEEWKEIDNTLKSIENDKGVFYHNQAGMWDVYLPQIINENNSVIVSKDGNTLSFSFEGELYDDDETTNINETTGQIEEKEYPEEYDEPDMQVLKKIASTVNYPDVYEDTDLRYDLISNCLKETVILNSYKEGLTGYRYRLDSEDLVLQLEEDKTILAYKKDELDGDPVFWLPAPYMYDNKGEYSHDIEVTLTKEENGYLLSYGLPSDWLSDSERGYPVRLDPIVQPTASYLTINDVDVPENRSTEYLDTILGIGYNARYTNGHRERVLMRFNSIPDLSSADIVVKGEIILYNTLVQYAMPIEAHEVYENWQSNTVTWSTLPSFNELVEDYQNVNTGNTTYTWDITNIAQHWYSNDLNTGVLFKAPDSVENAGIERYSQFYSSEYDYGHVTLMRLYYVNNCGLEGIWGYTSHSAERAGTGYINDYTGNLVWINEGLSFPGNRMPVSINHVYNANDKENNSFGLGYGWRTNFNQLVYQWSQDSSYYVWEDEDGTRHYFAYKSANTYEDESGNGLILTNNGSGTAKYCIKDKKDNKSYFDTQGRLTKISNDQATVSSIQISYVGDTSKRINEILDGAGRKYKFIYNGTELTQISYYGTGSNILSYRTFSHTGDNLTSIGYPDNENVSFTYTDTSHLLKNATGPGGYRINYTYSSSSPKRVIKVREYGNDTLGGTLNIEYSHNQTTFTDHHLNQIIKQFNHWGSTVSVQDGLGRGEFFDYKNRQSNQTDDLNTGSTLAVSSKLQDTVINQVKNGSFETNAYWLEPSSNASTGSWGYTADQHYYGQKSLYITRTENDTAFRVSPTSGNRFTLEEGKTYTVSAYVKTTGMDGTGSGARITITEEGHTAALARSTAVTVTSSWVRLEATYTRPEGSGDINGNIYLENFSIGTAYFDAIQFEEAAFASRYNMVENADFRMKGDTESDSYKWAKSSDCNTSDKRVSLSAGSANHLLDSHAFKVIGETNKNKRYYQTINQSGESGDVYTLAGWAKGDSVPLHDDRRFALLCQFQNTDGTTTDRYVSFNPDKDSQNSWQYAADRVLANKDYSSIKVMVVYDHNQNTVYFDGIQLYKEQFGHSYVYDEDNNLISVSDLKNKKTQYEYTDNELTKITLPTGPIEEYTYDSHHNVLTATDQDGIEMAFVYDQYGNNTKLTVQKNSVKSVVTATYTSDGNYLSSVTDSLGNTTYHDHDTQTGVLNWVQEPGQSSSNRLTYTYDDMYRTTDLTMGSYTAEFSYTSQGKLDEIESPSGTVYDFTYSTNFKMPKQIKIGNRELIFNNYNNSQDRLLTKTTYANGDYVQYSYDDWYRPIKMTYEDSETVDFIYGTDGALGRMYDSESGRTTKYMYDFQGLVKRIDETGDNYSNSVRYTYDSTNVLTTMKQIVNGASFTTSYEYDDDDRTSKISRSTMSETFLYDSLGRLSNNEVKNSNVLAAKTIITYKDGIGESDTTGKVNTWKVRRYNAGSQSGGVDYSYNYNEKGNISSVTRGGYTTDYVYDVKGQLTRVNDQYADKTWVYTYNKGNLKTRKEYAYTTGDPVNEISSVTYTYGDSTWKDLLTKYGNTNYTYDPSGNLTNNGEWTFTWKHGSELDSMSNGTDTVSFLYDAEGKRISKTVNGTTVFQYDYADGRLTRIKKNNTTLHFDYDMLGPSVIRYNGVDYYYHRNAQGDIDGISNAAGELVASYRYDAWGKPLSITGTMASTIGVLNPFRYRGYVYDEETGLYYLNTRYYDPEIGRFISPDSVSYLGADGTILGYDLYTYCDNDPVNNKDSDGNLASWIIGGIVGGIVGGISSALKGENVFTGVVQGVASGVINGLAVDTGSVFLGFFVGFAVSALSDIHNSGLPNSASEWGGFLLKAFVAGATNVTSIGVSGVLPKQGGIFGLCKNDIYDGAASLYLGALDATFNEAVDSGIKKPQNVNVQVLPKVNTDHFGGGKVVMMCA